MADTSNKGTQVNIDNNSFSNGEGVFNYTKALDAIESDDRLSNFEKKLMKRRVQKIQDSIGSAKIGVRKDSEGNVLWNWKDASLDSERKGGVTENARTEVGFGGKGFLGLKGKGYDRALDYMVLNGGVKFDRVEETVKKLESKKPTKIDVPTTTIEDVELAKMNIKDNSTISKDRAINDNIPAKNLNKSQKQENNNKQQKENELKGYVYDNPSEINYNAEYLPYSEVAKTIRDTFGNNASPDLNVYYSKSKGVFTGTPGKYAQQKDGELVYYEHLPPDVEDVSYLSRYDNIKPYDEKFKFDPHNSEQYYINETGVFKKGDLKTFATPKEEWEQYLQNERGITWDEWTNSLTDRLYKRKRNAPKWEGSSLTEEDYQVMREIEEKKQREELEKRNARMKKSTNYNPIKNSVEYNPVYKKGGLLIKPGRKFKSGGLIPKHSWGSILGTVSTIAGTAGNIISAFDTNSNANTGTTVETQNQPKDFTEEEKQALITAAKSLDEGGNVPKTAFGNGSMVFNQVTGKWEYKNNIKFQSKFPETINPAEDFTINKYKKDATLGKNKYITPHSSIDPEGETNLAKFDSEGSSFGSTLGDIAKNINISDIAQIVGSKPIHKEAPNKPMMKAPIIAQPKIEGLSFDDEARMRKAVLESNYIDTNSADPKIQAAVAMAKGKQSRNIADSFNSANAKVTQQSRNQAKQVASQNQLAQTETDNKNAMINYENKMAKAQGELEAERAKKQWVTDSVQRVLDRGEMNTNFSNSNVQNIKDNIANLEQQYTSALSVNNETLAQQIQTQMAEKYELLEELEQDKSTYGSLYNFGKVFTSK